VAGNAGVGTRPRQVSWGQFNTEENGETKVCIRETLGKWGIHESSYRIHSQPGKEEAQGGGGVLSQNLPKTKTGSGLKKNLGSLLP